MPELSADAEALLRDVEASMRDRGARRVGKLTRLARMAPPSTDAWRYATLELARQAVTKRPWHASALARQLLRVAPNDDGAWAVLGLAMTLLGNHRYAARAYKKAVRLAPQNPWYAHNLGHLLDVVLNRSAEAVPLLARAAALLGDSLADDAHRARLWREVTESYALALARSGDVLAARQVMLPVVRQGATPEQHRTYAWIVERCEVVLQRLGAHVAVPTRRLRKRRYTG